MVIKRYFHINSILCICFFIINFRYEKNKNKYLEKATHVENNFKETFSLWTSSLKNHFNKSSFVMVQRCAGVHHHCTSFLSCHLNRVALRRGNLVRADLQLKGQKQPSPVVDFGNFYYNSEVKDNIKPLHILFK